MFKHIVMYKLKNSSAENCKALVDTFLSMKGKIPQLLQINAGADVLNSERSFDVVLECLFNSIEAMNEYKRNEVHMPIMAYVKERVEKSHSVDYIV